MDSSGGPFGPTPFPVDGGHPVLGCVAEVAAAVKGVADVEPVFMSPAQKEAALARLTVASSMVEALRMRVIAGADDLAEQVGSRDVSTLLSARSRTSRVGTRRAERLARDLDTRWRILAAATTEGRVHVDQAHVIARCQNTIVDGDVARDPELRNLDLRPGTALMDRAEAHLVELADQFGPEELARLGDSILERVAPEVYEDEERKKLEAAERRAAAATRLTISSRGDGTADLRGRIPQTAADRLKSYLESFTSPRHQAMTKAGCKSGSGSGLGLGAFDGIDPATGRRLPYDRLLGEAFCAFLEAADPNRPPLHGGSATSLVLTMKLADLVAGTGAATSPNGTRVSVGEFRRLACTSGIIPMVLDGESRILDQGRAKRLYESDQRLGMAVRDGVCRAEHCYVPADWCEAHHKKPWSQGGHTDLDDGVLLCPWHHHRAHDPTYDASRMPNGDVRFSRRT